MFIIIESFGVVYNNINIFCYLLEKEMLQQSTQIPLYNATENASQSTLQKNVAQILQQNVTENELQSQILTSAYQLKSKLANSKLSLELQDFTTLTIYQRHLSDEDVGKDIHKKVDIYDLYVSLSILKQGNFQIGQIVKFQDVNCFKVQKDGVLVIYVNVFDKFRNQDVSYASSIIMNQTKKLLKNEVSTLKGYSMIHTQLQELKIVNQRLETRVVNLTEQIKNCEAKFKQISIQNQNMKQKLNKIQQKQQKIPFSILAGLVQPRFDHFRLNNYLFQFIGPKVSYNKNGYFMFNKVIAQNQQTKFKVKITRSPNKGIAVGITNYLVQKQRPKDQAMVKQKSQTLYIDSEGNNNFDNYGVHYNSFKQWDEIETVVNLSTKKISWFINNKVVKLIEKSALLENRNAVLVPFVQITYVNDIVEYVQ